MTSSIPGLPADIDTIGAEYIGRLAEVCDQWLETIPDSQPIGVMFSGGIDSGCVTATPICDDSGATPTCVECLQDMHCSFGGICDPQGFICRVPCFNGNCRPGQVCDLIIGFLVLLIKIGGVRLYINLLFNVAGQ